MAGYWEIFVPGGAAGVDAGGLSGKGGGGCVAAGAPMPYPIALGLAPLEARLLTTTAGRFFEAAGLVTGNGSRTTSPNSNGIAGVVVRVVPDRGEDGRARPRRHGQASAPARAGE